MEGLFPVDSTCMPIDKNQIKEDVVYMLSNTQLYHIKKRWNGALGDKIEETSGADTK